MTRDELARLLCETEPAAPEPDAPIYIGMRTAQAWEARLPQADKLIAAGVCLIRRIGRLPWRDPAED